MQLGVAEGKFQPPPGSSPVLAPVFGFVRLTARCSAACRNSGPPAEWCYSPSAFRRQPGGVLLPVLPYPHARSRSPPHPGSVSSQPGPDALLYAFPQFTLLPPLLRCIYLEANCFTITIDCTLPPFHGGSPGTSVEPGPGACHPSGSTFWCQPPVAVPENSLPGGHGFPPGAWGSCKHSWKAAASSWMVSVLDLHHNLTL